MGKIPLLSSGVSLLGWSLLIVYSSLAFSLNEAVEGEATPRPAVATANALGGAKPGGDCLYWKKHLNQIIQKQSYPSDYKDNYVITRGRKLVIQGYVALVKECELGSAARADIFQHICALSVELVRKAEPDVLSMTMTQLTTDGWERISLHQFNEHLQETYCRGGGDYPLVVGH